MKKAFVYTIILVSLSCFIRQTLHAIPAYPGPIIFTQPDGTKLNIHLKGDEKVKWAITADGYTLLFNDKGFLEYAELNKNGDLVTSGIIATNSDKRQAEEKAFLSEKKKELVYSKSQISLMRSVWEIQDKVDQKAFPKSGSQKLACILIGFTDLAFSRSQSEFNNLLNQNGYAYDGATGSVHDYYSEVSYGQLDLTIDIAGPYTASNEMAYYGKNDNYGDDIKPRELVTEALQLADNDLNFADYDNDKDGYVDGVYIIYAGHGEEAGASDDAIWAHAWNISPISLDGVTISRYSCSAELRGNSGSNLTRIGVICHEFGHVLGAPDFYDTDYSSSGGNFIGTGKWDVMASGSWNNGGATPAHHNAFTKTYIFNWADPVLLNTEATVSMKTATLHSEDFYKFNTTTAEEYYLTENRTKTGFDSYIPGEGLMIYHVHKDVLNVGNRINAGHPQKMHPVCANSSSVPSEDPVSYGDINSSSCPFPGSGNVASFTDNTLPHAKSWNEENTNQPLTNIVFHAVDETITFDFMGGDSGDQGENCSNALSLAGETGSKNSSTIGFKDDFQGSCQSAGADRIYYLTTPVMNGGTVELWTSNSDFDAVLYARIGSCSGTEIACSGNPDENTISWENTTGSDQNIWIIVDGENAIEGNTSLHWKIVQPIIQGNDCENPYVISGLSGSVWYKTTDHTNDNFSNECNGTAADVVFFLETPVPVGSTIDFWTSDDNYDVVLYGRYGSCSGIQIACVDDPDGSLLSWENNTETEQYIYIIADGYGSSSGKAKLNWSVSDWQKPGETCNNPILITGNSGSIEYTTIGYNNDYTGNCESTGADKVFYLDTPVPDGYTLELWASGEDYDAMVYGKYGSCDGTEIGCYDEKTTSVLSWVNETGNTQGVWIIADGLNHSKGTGVLNWNMHQTITGTDINTSSSSVTIYPNPAADYIMLKFDDGNQDIEYLRIFGILGNLIKTYNVNNQYSSDFSIDVSDFAEGTYIVEIQMLNSSVRKKIEVIR